MRNSTLLTKKFLVLFIVLGLSLLTYPALADTAKGIDQKVEDALKTLYKTTPAAKEFSKIAKGILVFPDIVKGGFIIGGQFGEGALKKDGKTAGYYNTIAASYGLQAGLQKFGYALFFITEKGLKYLESSNGWEIGVGPTIVIVDKGAAGAMTTTTGKDDIYAFFFSQKGLMAGLGLQGSKITPITPDK